jgi:hypothetical protein
MNLQFRADNIDVKQLRQRLADTFSLDELQTLCFELDIEYEDIPGVRLEDKTRELVLYCRRRNLLIPLLHYCQKVRPLVEWTTTPVTLSQNEEQFRKQQRRELKNARRNVNLVHTIRPSSQPGQKFDILIYLIRQGSDDLTDVDRAEFFLGKYWGNKIFRIQNQEGFIGLAISAYGELLCTCKVVFKDGHEIILERYLDFEMKDSISRSAKLDS